MNTKDGKINNVLIEDSSTDLRVWADPGMKDIISSVPGITWCDVRSSTEYIVHFDHRYDVEWIKQEIIAQVKIEDAARTQQNTARNE